MLRAIGLSVDQSDSSIRFSFGRFTTDAEIDEAARLVTESLETIIRGSPDNPFT